MSMIHVNQIRVHVSKLFDGLIDLSDQSGANAAMREDFLLTRGLAAYAVHHLTGASAPECAQAVTDGGGDNGLDAIYYDDAEKRLLLVQSKWIKSGNGEPENGEVKKFVAGIRDLINGDFDRFNARVGAKRAIVEKALADPSTRYEVVLAYTGLNSLAEPSQRDLNDLAEEMNDTSEVLYVTVLHQTALHASLTAGVAGEPINLAIALKSWGKKDAPHEAYYGQLAGPQIVLWWTTYRQRLFARNIRSVLGETDINAEIRQTLEARQGDFWYFNNGITVLARRASRSMAGGAGNDFSTFHCEDVSIVNGAQTVGTIGKFGESNPALVDEVYVPVRIIVRGDDATFGDKVTRANNRQNRIEGRDFVTLDPEQARIRTELLIDGVDYMLMRSESVTRSETSFDLVEATTALACASGSVRLAVQLKREIGKLWEDTSKAPYKELFNGGVPGLSVWRAVQMQRRIERAIENAVRARGGRLVYNVGTHGNRFVSALIFSALEVVRFKDPAYSPEIAVTDEVLAKLTDARVSAVVAALTKHYGNAMIPTLFKNAKKCEHIAAEVKRGLVAVV